MNDKKIYKRTIRSFVLRGGRLTDGQQRALDQYWPEYGIDEGVSRLDLPQLFGNCESRELRGGSAKSDAWSIRLNARASFLRQSRSPDVGMRVVMQLPR